LLLIAKDIQETFGGTLLATILGISTLNVEHLCFLGHTDLVGVFQAAKCSRSPPLMPGGCRTDYSRGEREVKSWTKHLGEHFPFSYSDDLRLIQEGRT
jgi:hypothetical protein